MRPRSQSLDTLDIDDIIDDDFKDKSLQRDMTPLVGRRGGRRRGPVRVGPPADRDELPLQLYTYPFENIVFEGGGGGASTVVAYCGAVRLLEELGVWPRVRRLAGVSSGAVVATLLALGYNSYQLEQLLTVDLPKVLRLDQGCGHCGLHAAASSAAAAAAGTRRLHKWLAQKIKDASGSADTTFAQIQQHFDKELAITVTNLTWMSPEYLHVKTAPNMPVRLACKMALAAPGICKPVKYKLSADGPEEAFVDGSLTCVYPVHTFDGWWLSMNPDDAFSKRIKDKSEVHKIPHQERFDSHSDKTIGILLYSDSDNDNFKDLLLERDGDFLNTPIPNTAMAKRSASGGGGGEDETAAAIDVKAASLAFALDRMLKLVRNHQLDDSKVLRHEDLQRIVDQKRHLHDEDLETVFGVDTTSPDVILMHVKHSKVKQVSYQELAAHLESRGLPLQYRFLPRGGATGRRPRHVTSMADLYMALQETMLVLNKRANVSNEDLSRTAGINTQYVGCDGGAADLDKADAAFLIEQGKRSMKAFLHAYITHGDLPNPLDDGDDDEDVAAEWQREELAGWGEEELSQIIDEDDYAENCDYLNVYHG